MSPLYKFPPLSELSLLDVLANPGDRPELVALLYQDGTIAMFDINTGAAIARFGEAVTAGE